MIALFATILDWLQSAAVAERVGWLLVHSVWQFALVALLACLVNRGLRQASAAARHGTLLAAMLLIAALPIATWLIVPTPNKSLGPTSTPVVTARVTEPREPFGDRMNGLENESPGGSGGFINGDAMPSRASAMATDVSASGPIAKPWSAAMSEFLRPWLSAIFGVWCAGVLLFSIRPAWSWCVVRRLRSVGVSPVAEAVQQAFERMCARLEIARPVRVLQSTLVATPVVVGCFRSVILLPGSFIAGVPMSQLEAIIAHELAHVRRYDYLVNLLQTLVETLFFYHPAVWWLSRCLRAERENCCDDLAVSVLGNRVEYGRALLAVEEFRGGISSSLALGARSGSLLARVKRLLAAPPHDTPRTAAGLWPFCLVLAAATTAVVWTYAHAETESGKPPSDLQRGQPFRLPDPQTTGDVSQPGWRKAELATGQIAVEVAVAAEPGDGGNDSAQLLRPEPTRSLADSLNVMSVGFDNRGDLRTVATRSKVAVRRWNIESGEKQGEVELQTDLHANRFLMGELQLSPDRSRVMAISDGEVVIWDAASGKELARLKSVNGLGAHRGLSCSGDFSRIACGQMTSTGFGDVDAQVAVWDVASGELVRTVVHASAVQIQSTALSTDGRWLATGSQDAGLCLWDLASGKLMHRIANENAGRQHPASEVGLKSASQVLALCFSPDNARLAMADMLGVKLIDVTAGKVLRDLPHPYRFGRSGLVFSPHGKLLARVGADQTVAIWNARTGKLVAELSSESHSGSFSRDGKWFAVGFSDQTSAVRVWKIAAVDPALEGATLASPVGRVANGATFSAELLDDNQILSAKDLKIPDVSQVNDPDELLRQLERGPRASQFLMTGGGIFWRPESPPESMFVELWNRSFAVEAGLDPRVKRLTQLGDRARDAVHQQLLTARPAVAGHLATVLRFTGDETSIPRLIQLLKKLSVSDGQAEGQVVTETSQLMAKLAATSALWELTGQKHVFTPRQWQEWWDGVQDGYVVARKRSRTALTDPQAAEVARRLIEELFRKEQPARDRLIAQGPAMIPHLVRALSDNRESRSSAPIARVLDELGATDKIPAGLRRAYFTGRVAAAWTRPPEPADEAALCRALSHLSFAEFCQMLLDVERIQGNGERRLSVGLPTWLHANSVIFSRRFQRQPNFMTNPTLHPHWKDVIPAESPAKEIADAVPILVSGLKHDNAAVRKRAAMLGDTIGLCSDQRPDLLIVALRDGWLSEQDAGVRDAMGFAMTRYSTPLVVKAFSDGLRSSRPEIVCDAAGYMGWVNISLNEETRADFELLKTLTRSEDAKLRSRAVRTLSDKAPDLLASELTRLATDPEEPVREWVSRIRTDDPASELIDALFVLTRDSKESIRTDAISAIGRMGKPELMSRLRPLLRDPKVHGWAVAAIVESGGKRSLPLLMEELKAGHDVGGMVYQHLKRLTGQSFEDKPEPWLAWWDRNPASDSSR